MSTGKFLLSGVTVPLVTPLDPSGRPAPEYAADLLGALHGHGVRQLMLLGSNGEGPLLPTSLLGPFLQSVIGQWRSLTVTGVVTVNATAAGTLEARERAELAASAGADALVLSPPIYFHHRVDEIVSHYAALADVGLPVIAYNAPRYSNPLTRDAADALLELDHVVGIKDSSGDLDFFGYLIERAGSRPDFAVSQGAEPQLAAALQAGADGIVPGVANIAPGIAIRLVAAQQANDLDEATGLQSMVDELTKLHAIRRGTAAVKEILAQRALCPPYVAPPLLRCEAAERDALSEFIVVHEHQLITATKGQHYGHHREQA